MASHLEIIARSRALLRSRALHDTKVKLFGFDADLLAIDAAFGALSMQYAELLEELVRLRLDLGERAPAPAEHAENCECRPCCLARMVALVRRPPKLFPAM